jgi:hypothetical protein
MLSVLEEFIHQRTRWPQFETLHRHAEDATQLNLFLGLLSYSRKFLPNLNSTLESLYELLQK